MWCSIVMSTRNKEAALNRTLESIRRQDIPFEYEIIVVDDGSSDDTKGVCDRWRVDQYEYLDTPAYRNPGRARNVGYKKATGGIIIAQSDEVLHFTPDVVVKMVDALESGWFVIASVADYNVAKQQRLEIYTSQLRRRHLFFLGCLYRKDLYAIGGNDEEFVAPGYEDDFFAQCLVEGRELKSKFLDSTVVGYHQHHDRMIGLDAVCEPSRVLYEKKMAEAKKTGVWCASGGPWTM